MKTDTEDSIDYDKLLLQTLEYNLYEHQTLIEQDLININLKDSVIILIDNCLHKLQDTNLSIEETEHYFKILSKLISINNGLTKSIIDTNVRINELVEVIYNLNKKVHPEDHRNGLTSLAESIRISIKELE